MYFLFCCTYNIMHCVRFFTVFMFYIFNLIIINIYFYINYNNPVRLKVRSIFFVKKNITSFYGVLYICIISALKILHHTTEKNSFHPLEKVFFYHLVASFNKQPSETTESSKHSEKHQRTTIQWNETEETAFLKSHWVEPLFFRRGRKGPNNTQKWAGWGWNKTSQKIDDKEEEKGNRQLEEQNEDASL